MNLASAPFLMKQLLVTKPLVDGTVAERSDEPSSWIPRGTSIGVPKQLTIADRDTSCT